MTTNFQKNQSKQETLEQKRQRLTDKSAEIIAIADNDAHSALRCIHLLSVAGGATMATYKAIEKRIIADKDAVGAYHLALLAQSTPDLPVDARKLIEMVIEHGDTHQLLALLKNLPLPPVDIIKAKVLASGDKNAIEAMTEYLQDNPEGYGSHVTLTSGQKDRIVPLSE